MTFAIQRSINGWNMGKQQDFQNILIPIISKTQRLSGGLNSEDLYKALEPYLTDSLFVYVFDKEKKPVFLFKQGRIVTEKELKEENGTFSFVISQLPYLPIKTGEETIAYLASDTIDFLADSANRSFVLSMRNTLISGVFITLFLSLIIGILISAGFSRQTGQLVSRISFLIKGQRQVEFPSLKIRELDEISRSVLALQNQLTKEEQLRQQWMQDISHDLKTPLTAVTSQFEAMIDGVLDIGQKRLVSLLSEVRRIEVLVLDLQELSRYESPDMKIRPQMIKSDDFIEDMTERFSFLAELRNIKLHFSAESIPLYIDEKLMQRCISNILQNALQYTVEGGTVDVSVSFNEGNISFHIKNSGYIPVDDLEKIFDRLYRGRKDREGGGSGLGLSIARAIVLLHGGQVQARNEDGSVLFTILIPSEIPSEK
jgi:two-component system sensor histidine kinase BaeS